MEVLRGLTEMIHVTMIKIGPSIVHGKFLKCGYF